MNRGHVIFVNLNGRTKIMLIEDEYDVLDKNGEDDDLGIITSVTSVNLQRGEESKALKMCQSNFFIPIMNLLEMEELKEKHFLITLLKTVSDNMKKWVKDFSAKIL